ncbi:zinc ribbon domain-containing protein [Paenibacillus sp. GYB003]|uniref:zinc ribbon domain-containing protein n=1 Tax=Paenibacillus sp. GYB003 TaxID=2994392 RepID=UPI002F96937C
MSFFEKMKEGAAKAAEKAKETVEVTRLNAQIGAKKKEIEKLQQNIGELVYQSYLSKDADLESRTVSLCMQIADRYQDIAALELKIKEVKNEKVCVCGAELAADIRFCPSCGHQFEPKPAEPDKTAPVSALGSGKAEDDQ